MKKAFSLLELIFAIVIIGIIASFAVPKLLDTRDSAVISTLKRDISSIISSVQSYHLIQKKIEKISDAITLNEQNWKIDEENANKIQDINECLTIEVKKNDSDIKVLSLQLNESSNEICTKLEDEGISSQEYRLL